MTSTTWKLLLNFTQTHPLQHADSDNSWPRLPPEILLIILELVDATLKGQRNQAERKRQTRLSSLALVSRTWYTAIVELLYPHPLLFTFQQLFKFRRTVDSCPHFRTRVVQLTFQDAFDEASPPSLRRQLGWSNWEQRRITLTKEHLKHVLHACESLISLSINLRHPVDYLPLGGTFHGPWVTTRLRELTVQGGSLDAMASMFSFPYLELLCIRHHWLTRNLRLPPFPRVHTLRLFQVSKGLHNNVFPPDAIQTCFPSLRSFEFRHDEVYGTMASPRVWEHVPNLEQFSFIQSPEIRDFSRPDGTVFDTVKHLVLGVIGASDYTFPIGRIPPRLESLVFFVAIDRKMGRVAPLIKVVHFLRFNADLLTGGRRKFRSMAINGWRGTHLGVPEPFLPLTLGIRDLCVQHGISLRFNDLDAAGWVLDQRHDRVPQWMTDIVHGRGRGDDAGQVGAPTTSDHEHVTGKV